jgi:cytochrome c-type biogenesis protein CcmH
VIGWLTLLLLIGFCLLLLRLLGVRGAVLQGCAAALLFGAAGYALQGRPGLSSAPARGAATTQALPLSDARHAFFGNFSSGESWLLMSEALARSGSSEDAVNILQNAVRRHPGDAQLWVGLGNALVEHGQGLTPAAELAYRKAMELPSGAAGGGFFYGLARARSGDRAGAVALWRGVLAKAPADASWRPLVEGGIAMLTGAAPAPAR